MRICIPVPCFFGKMDFCEAIAKIAQLGFDAAETYLHRGILQSSTATSNASSRPMVR